MNLDTLEMPVEEAQARLAEYEQIVHTERTAEDAAIAAGYRAAARGLPVIELSRVIAAGGWFPTGLPRLAIARADATEVHVEVTTPAHARGRADLGERRHDYVIEEAPA